ncbi:MAG: PfkB family carbohydrate kinase [Mycobacterium sp.]
MTIWVAGAYIRDTYVYTDGLPRNGESIDAQAFRQSDGGKAANQAVMAARLAAQTEFVGVIGHDDIGDSAVRLFRAEGVGITAVQRHDGPTGESIILSAADGEQAVITWTGAADQLQLNAVVSLIDTAPGPSYLSIQGELPLAVNAQLAGRLSDRATIVCNPSPVKPFLSADWDWGPVDIVVANELEADAILGGGRDWTPTTVAEAVHLATGVETVVVTLGHNGASCRSDTEGSFLVAAPSVTVLDSTGAGDAFTGAMLAALSAGASLREACDTGVFAASYSVTEMYCIPSYPTAVILARWKHELGI